MNDSASIEIEKFPEIKSILDLWKQSRELIDDITPEYVDSVDANPFQGIASNRKEIEHLMFESVLYTLNKEQLIKLNQLSIDLINNLHENKRKYSNDVSLTCEKASIIYECSIEMLDVLHISPIYQNLNHLFGYTDNLKEDFKSYVEGVTSIGKRIVHDKS